MNELRVVAVLSGGGAKAAAHVGAIEALHERGILPVHYVGTSMGAVVAACFASGLTYREVLKRIMRVTRRDVAAFSAGAVLGWFAPSLFRAGPLRGTIERLVPVRRFDELKYPLTVTTVDGDSGELLTLGAGGRSHVPLLDALYASCALPLYYPPGRIGDRMCLDGGIRAVLPLGLAAAFEPDVLFAVDAGPSLHAERVENRSPAPAMVRGHDSAMRILMASQAEEEIARCRKGPVPLLLVRPIRRQSATFAVEDIVSYVEEGYRAATRTLDRWATKHLGGQL